MSKESINFLNYWNLKQVIYVEGKLELTIDLAKLITNLKEKELIPKMSENLGGKILLTPEEIKTLY